VREKRNEPLVIAMPKGALYAESAARLAHVGIVVPADPGRRLKVLAEDGLTEILFLRPADVPAYVEFGAADCGIVGKDVLWETDREVCELADLGFGFCRLVVAGRRIDGYHEGVPLPTFFRAATKFLRTAESYFHERDLPAQLVPLHGSVELAPLVGLADIIVDLVATGATLREHDLVVVHEIDTSTARFVVNPVRFRSKYREITHLLHALLATSKEEDLS
jgi:ATP phosphoribosyltransferase